MSEFNISESKPFEKVKKKVGSKLYQKIKNIVFPQPRKNPHSGTNIKKFKGEFAEYYRFRIGRYRLFYLVDIENVSLLLFVFSVARVHTDKPAAKNNDFSYSFPQHPRPILTDITALISTKIG